MATTEAYFKLAGSDFVEIVRDLVLEEDWEHALSILKDCVHGCTYDQAIAVLAGDMTFVGINSLMLVMEDEEVRQKYLESLTWLYAGAIRYKPGKVIMRPYAHVTNWGPNDVTERHKHPNRYHKSLYMIGGSGRNLGRFDPRFRSVAYMNDPVNDRAEILYMDKQQRVVLFTPIAGLPVWYKAHGSWQEALDGFLAAGGTLRERGHFQSFGNLQEFDNPKVVIPARGLPVVHHEPGERRDPSSIMEQLALETAVLTGLPLEGIQSTLDALSGQQDTESAPVPDPGLTADHGYITKDGKFYPCRFHEHAALATRIFRHLHDGRVEADPDKAGELEGWIKISTSQSDGTIGLHYYADKPKQPNQRQRETALNWCLAHNHPPSSVSFLCQE